MQPNVGTTLFFEITNEKVASVGDKRLSRETADQRTSSKPQKRVRKSLNLQPVAAPAATGEDQCVLLGHNEMHVTLHSKLHRSAANM